MKLTVSRGLPHGASPSISLEALLLQAGFLTQDQINRLSIQCQSSKVPLFEFLANRKDIDEKALGHLLAQYYHVHFIEPESIAPQEGILTLLPEAFMARNQVYPLSLSANGKRLEFLMLEPDRFAVIDEISLLSGARAVPRVTTPRHMLALLKDFSHYKVSADAALALAEEAGRDSGNTRTGNNSGSLQQEMAADEAPVVQLVNALLAEAIMKNASDVHLESHREVMIVRFRIDGLLRDIKTVPKDLATAVISRIKVSAGMDIAEHRRPQDGRIRFALNGMEVDMRVNTLAVQYGESCVLRLLRSGSTSVGLEQLGLHAESSRRLLRMTHAPNGIILVTGPTGSGKTTTLYSCLREINSRERKILTIEDPIEYPMPGINQTQVSHKAGLSFAVALRAMMRQDPDVILLGEIRDKETLESAMHASLTGHLVFSTIHTNSTAKTITRLKEMGAPGYLISSTVCGIVAQRLIRKICDHCKTPYQASIEELKTLGFHDTSNAITLHKGAGCSACEYTGYQGRIGIYEIMDLSRSVQDLIDNDVSSIAIEDQAIKEGMITLAMDGEHKIAAGLTTVDEVNRVLGIGW
jgi:type II secretory ATPase GspE/PulE/Tfp pilus assembly ATPase PilB-like protein